MLIQNDDVFEVYYAESINEKYESSNKVRQEVYADSALQTITFRLPNRVYPFKLRIDFGSLGYETPIELHEISISTGGKTIAFDTIEIWKRFRLNPNMELVDGRKTLMRRKIHNSYDPFLLSNDLTKIVVNLFTD